MKKQALKSFMIVSLFAIAAVASAYGQLQNGIAAEVPFDFMISDMKLPAGEYIIQYVSGLARRGVLLLRDADGHRHAMIVTNPVQAKTMQEPMFVFHRYADHYFLSQIWTGGNSTGHELSKSRAERELAKSKSSPQIASIGGHRR